MTSTSDSGANRLPDLTLIEELGLAQLQPAGINDPGVIADLAKIAGAEDAPLLHGVPSVVIAILRDKFWTPTQFQVTIGGAPITCVAAARRRRVPKNEIIPIWIALQSVVRDATSEPVNASRLITSSALPPEILVVHWDQGDRSVFVHRPGVSRETLRLARGRVRRAALSIGLLAPIVFLSALLLPTQPAPDASPPASPPGVVEDIKRPLPALPGRVGRRVPVRDRATEAALLRGEDSA